MPDQSPTTRLREIVEADREGSPTALSEEAFDLVMCRLARAVADPAFVEKVARALAARRGLDPDEMRDWRGRTTNTKAPIIFPTWQAFQGEAACCLSFLAAHALGEK